VGRRRLAWLAIPALAACAGCGNARSQPTGTAGIGAPVSIVNFTSPSGDVSFGHPSSWSLSAGTAPQVAQISSGGAVDTVYAYPRSHLPVDTGEAESARRRLLSSLAERAPGFRVRSSRVRVVDEAPAVEIVGRGRIAGHRVMTKSVHVYKGRGEYVIDAFSRPAVFRQAEADAFDPLIATLHVRGHPETAAPTSGSKGG
jgi:hypothetical protein